MTPVDLADEIYTADLDCPLDTSIPRIVFKLLALIGTLNTKLDLCIAVTESDTLDPELTTDQAAVLRQIFLVAYYGKKIRDHLGASGVQWTEIREADSVIKRTSKTDLAKTYLSLKQDSERELDKLVGQYRINYAIVNNTDYCE